MTDYTTTQGRLLARASYLLKVFGSMVVHQDTVNADGVMMCEAAAYIERLERDLKTAKFKGHPQYIVIGPQTSYGPNRRRQTWYEIVDRASPRVYGAGYERVAVAYDPTDARKIAEIMNECRIG